MKETMKTLTLPLKREYFEAIRDGSKSLEYRLYTKYWRTRLVKREYDQVVFTLGYPKKTDQSRRISRPWRGYTLEMITHKEFGEKPVLVFAIKAN